MNFTINSDTLDVNELIKAAYAGSNFALSDSTFAFSDENEDDIIEAADTSVTAFIIPRNIDMDVDVLPTPVSIPTLNCATWADACRFTMARSASTIFAPRAMPVA